MKYIISVASWLHILGTLFTLYIFVLQMFRTFVGTNLNPLWEKFLVSSDGKLMVQVATLKLVLFYRILLLFNY